jgi:membrane-anchored protein YejM (alkaline phosphatase superfamily)
MHSLVRILLGLFLVFVGESPAFTNADSAARPNILIVTADNHGYGDLQCFNPGSAIQTPNLDRLASEGVKLTDFYTPSSTCTVSRAVVTALDRAIGRVLDSLDELGLSDNTFVFFLLGQQGVHAEQTRPGGRVECSVARRRRDLLGGRCPRCGSGPLAWPD